ncbi:hypothetical protein JAAARDRAFT_49184 [Jaapia argillacea MUCL 33604]|uniref:HMG box domain-containing protein n=1 Tax=Jaapia argillacea MUCL 33604 TaxID=933084 RepID=A0A067PL41_9AGAM|nr:hypothetical protein JAAARDRAFT_49184 [Jaapia argillacea MUCL 33604]
MSPPSYENWTREQLIARINEIERLPASHTVKSSSDLISSHPDKKGQKPFVFSSHPRRKIALKFCYSGWEYNGLAFQNIPTPLPTVESVLFDALAFTRLIDPSKGFDGCGWEKCGRTDRGVSAAGQVISLWVRSALGQNGVGEERRNGSEVKLEEDGSGSEAVPDLSSHDALVDCLEGEDILSSTPLLPEITELQYVSKLNNVLPPTIRILAWSPVADDFSARFDCQHRHYKYFFTSHGLDVSRMQEAAQRLVGEHDFRNLCKLDASKQITQFRRNILRADVNPVEDSQPEGSPDKMFVLDLIGSAFLYHQVRHIMAILFLVGTGLEQPSVVSALLNADPDHREIPREGEQPIELVDRKPLYEMADSLPLVLWDCAYDDSRIQWRTDGEATSRRQGPEANLYNQLHSIASRSHIHTVLDRHFLAAAARYHPAPAMHFPLSPNTTSVTKPGMLSVPLGGGSYRRTGKYVPLLQRKRLDSVEVVNERYRVGKGDRRAARKASAAVDERDGDEDTRVSAEAVSLAVLIGAQMPKETTKSTKSKKKAADKAEKAPRAKAKKDPNAPKRALSAYMFFSSDWRERIKAENPDAGFGEVGKLLGAKWKEMDDEEKKPYVEQAAKDKERAEEEKAAYENKKDAGSGGSGAEDDDE